MNIQLKSQGFQAIINTQGAELKSFCHPDGRETIWQSNPEFWKSSSPLLFPLIGNSRKNQCIIEGNIYNIPKHGIVRYREFSCVNHSENTAVFSLPYDEDTLRFYPYKFLLSVEYTLEAGTLHIRYIVSNKDERKMYYQIGAHPGFICPMRTKENFDQYTLFFEKEEDFALYAYDLKQLHFNSEVIYRYPKGKKLHLSKEMFAEDALYFPFLRSRRVSLVNSFGQAEAEVEFKNFSSLALWTPFEKGAKFICIEPWNGSAILDKEGDILKDRHDIQCLQSRQEEVYELYIRI